MTELVRGQIELRETAIPVGMLASLHRYPVKSMRGEALTAAEIRFQGIRGDRRFAFIQGHDRSRFPWLTAREVPRMLLYQAALADPTDPDNSPALITTPAGRQLDVFSDELIDELRAQWRAPARNQPIYAVHLKSAHDAEPVSLVTTHALRRLSALLGETVDARRFRQNLVIDTDGAACPDEQTWIGGRLVIGTGPGAVTLVVTRGDERCMMPNLHPDTAVQDGRILRTIAQEQDNVMGVYASVAQQGTIHVGDPVYLIAAAR